MAVQIEKIKYGGWANCLRLQNGCIELIATLDVGPRLIRFGFIGGENMLCEVKDTLGKTGGDDWRIYGGHRLWHSPEDKVRTYEPDNAPVSNENVENGVILTQKVEESTGIQKQMAVRMAESGAKVSVKMQLTNKNLWPIELAIWSLTVMSAGGLEVVPQPNADTGLLGNRVLALWPYTDMADERVHWGKEYIALCQKPGNKQPFKFGINSMDGWAAYFNHGNLFVKSFLPVKNAKYPDFGCSYETYTNDFMLEMETLSPLKELSKNETIEHEETWELFEGCEKPSDFSKAVIEKALADKIRR